MPCPTRTCHRQLQTSPPSSRKSPAIGGCLLGHSWRGNAGRCGDFPRTCHSSCPQNYLHSHIVWQVNFGLSSQSPRLSPTSTSNVTPLTSSATSFPQCHPSRVIPNVLPYTNLRLSRKSPAQDFVQNIEHLNRPYTAVEWRLPCSMAPF